VDFPDVGILRLLWQVAIRGDAKESAAAAPAVDVASAYLAFEFVNVDLLVRGGLILQAVHCIHLAVSVDDNAEEDWRPPEHENLALGRA
jgi:hypothetical protein